MLKKQGIRPIKRLGQNFLINKGVLKTVIEAASLSSEDTVLEIGPGTGVLTLALAEKVKKVIAVEKDIRMIKILKETLKGFKNVEIIQGDILKLSLKIKNYKVIGNLPFYLTAPVIRKFLELTEVNPQSMVFIIQKEVAQRICSKPPRMNLLAVSVQLYADPKIISYVSKKSFWPQPEVDAAIIKITPNSLLIRGDDLFFKIVKAGFSQPRKQLINNFSKGLKMNKEETKNWLRKNKISPTQRAETLKIEDWLKLTKSYKV
ncbi:Ribosomal RNA small subunit methyltransferase A [subsurface metagenome]